MDSKVCYNFYKALDSYFLPIRVWYFLEKKKTFLDIFPKENIFKRRNGYKQYSINSDMKSHKRDFNLNLNFKMANAVYLILG